MIVTKVGTGYDIEGIPKSPPRIDQQAAQGSPSQPKSPSKRPGHSGFRGSADGWYVTRTSADASKPGAGVGRNRSFSMVLESPVRALPAVFPKASTFRGILKRISVISRS